MAKKRIPADIFDTLELSAVAFGGIGRNWMWEGFDTPRCILGHAQFAAGEYDDPEYDEGPIIRALLRAMGVKEWIDLGVKNDVAITSINRRKGVPLFGRVSWDEYVQEMGWERAES